MFKTTESPLYQQLYRQLRYKIEAGDWLPGTQLPSEREMAAYHGICRQTARKALELLAYEGYVAVHQGRGYFVNRL